MLLTFERADAAPRAKVLANTATEAMQDEAFDHIKTYRLPCLPAGARVESVQEFVFDRDASSQVSILRALPSARNPGEACVVMPRKAPETIFTRTEDPVSKTIFELRFEGDGSQPPAVKILYSTSGERVQQAMIDYASEYRAPCRKAGDPPATVEQPFIYVRRGVKPAGFKERRVSLDKFLGWVKDADALRADFDFDTMACPFKVTWELRRPHLPNRTWVETDSTPDPNRAELLAWLAGMNLKLKEELALPLFTERFDIDIPCGRLALPKPG